MLAIIIHKVGYIAAAVVPTIASSFYWRLKPLRSSLPGRLPPELGVFQLFVSNILRLDRSHRYILIINHKQGMVGGCLYWAPIPTQSNIAVSMIARRPMLSQKDLGGWERDIGDGHGTPGSPWGSRMGRSSDGSGSLGGGGSTARRS